MDQIIDKEYKVASPLSNIISNLRLVNFGSGLSVMDVRTNFMYVKCIALDNYLNCRFLNFRIII